MAAGLLFYGALLAAAYALGRIHALHALVLPSSRRLASRSDTTNQVLFCDLSRFYHLPSRYTPCSIVSSRPSSRATVTLQFGRDTPDDVIITAPPHSSSPGRAGSAWATPRVRHASAATCRRLDVESGRWVVGQFYGGGRPANGLRELLGAWAEIAVMIPEEGQPPYLHNVANQIRRYGSPLAQQLDHQLASAALDAERYFHLCTTPLWLRLGHMVLELVSSSAADFLVTRMLRVQSRAMLHAHDTAEYSGCATFLRHYYIMWPPQWVLDFERRSEIKLAHWWGELYTWLGRNVLGMQAEYAEYRLEVGETKVNMVKVEVWV